MGEIYIAVVFGIVISVIPPIVRSYLPNPLTVLKGPSRWKIVRPYIATGIYSMAAGILIVVTMGDQLMS